MNSNQQTSPSTALVPSSKPISSILATGDSLHGSIGSDLSSPGVKSQVMLSRHSAPSSPSKLHSLSKQTKSIEELRRDLLAFKDRNQVTELIGVSKMQSSDGRVQIRETHSSMSEMHLGAHVEMHLVSHEKLSQSSNTSSQSRKEIHPSMLAKQNLKNAEHVESGGHLLNEAMDFHKSSKGGHLMLEDNTHVARTHPSIGGVSNASCKEKTSTDVLPLQLPHNKPCVVPLRDNSHYVPDKDVKVSSLANPRDIHSTPAVNTQVSPPSLSNCTSLPPTKLETGCLPDVDLFPPLNNIKAPTTQPKSGAHPSSPHLHSAESPPNTSKHSGNSWASLFSANRSKTNGLQLEFIQESAPSSKDQNPSISVTIDEVHEELNRWNNALVGYVIGAKPPYKMMKQFVERKWKSFGQIDTLLLRSGIFLFQFENEQTKLKVMELGPWSYFDKPLILKPWSPHCSYEKEEVNSIPIWVRFPYLKLHLWSAKILSKLASQIGQPLFSDSMTATKQRLAFARVCVEIAPTDELPQFIEIIDHDGIIHTQAVEYEWVPKVCKLCKSVNHGVNNCPKVVRKEWRPRAIHDNTPKQQGQAASQASSSMINVPKSPTSEVKDEIGIKNKFSALECITFQQAEDLSPRNSSSLSGNAAHMDGEHQKESQMVHGGPSNIGETAPPAAGNEPFQATYSPQLIGSVEVQGEAKELNAVGAKCADQMETPEGSNDEAEKATEQEQLKSLEAEWEVKLSRSQRKKLGKMQYALTNKQKANQAKSLSSSPNSQ